MFLLFVQQALSQWVSVRGVCVEQEDGKETAPKPCAVADDLVEQQVQRQLEIKD